MRYYYKPIRIVKIKTKEQTIPIASKNVEQQEFLFFVGGNTKCYTTEKTLWQFLTKLNMVLPYNLAIVSLDKTSADLKTYTQKHTHKCL